MSQIVIFLLFSTPHIRAPHAQVRKGYGTQPHGRIVSHSLQWHNRRGATPLGHSHWSRSSVQRGVRSTRLNSRPEPGMGKSRAGTQRSQDGTASVSGRRQSFGACPLEREWAVAWVRLGVFPRWPDNLGQQCRPPSISSTPLCHLVTQGHPM